jgi:hypothetical protein
VATVVVVVVMVVVVVVVVVLVEEAGNDGITNLEFELSLVRPKSCKRSRRTNPRLSRTRSFSGSVHGGGGRAMLPSPSVPRIRCFKDSK